MIEQMRADDSQRREALRFGSSSSAPSNQQDEGYMAYMQRQIQQRTEKLNIMGDSMDRLEQTSSGWAEDVNKFVSSQKKKAVMGSKYLFGISGLHVVVDSDRRQSLEASLGSKYSGWIKSTCSHTTVSRRWGVVDEKLLKGECSFGQSLHNPFYLLHSYVTQC